MYQKLYLAYRNGFNLIVIAGFILMAFPAFSQTLNPGDGIRLTFYNISDAISGDFYVQKNNSLQLPYIGNLSTEDRLFEDIRDEVVDKYKAIYRNPELNVLPLYRINVFGEVRNPGSYYVTGVEKLSDLLAMAGGETDRASLGKIYLVQDSAKVDINAKEILQKGERINDIGMESGDQVYVPRKKFVSLLSAPTLISLGALFITSYGIMTRNND